MNAASNTPVGIRDTILAVLRERAKVEPAVLAPNEDVFAQFGLNSMDAFAVLVRLEREFDVVIGEDTADFERVGTFSGLESLLAEKVGARNPPPQGTA